MSAIFSYSIDTSSLIHGWARAYPISEPVFTPIWNMFDRMIAEGRLRASVEVLHEIKKKDDDLAKWCKKRHNMFIETGNSLLQQKSAEIVRKYEGLVDVQKGLGKADPFVIAYALTENPVRTVVTEEGRKGTLAKPKIPFVCQEEGIRCINILDLIREQKLVP